MREKRAVAGQGDRPGAYDRSRLSRLAGWLPKAGQFETPLYSSRKAENRLQGTGSSRPGLKRCPFKMLPAFMLFHFSDSVVIEGISLDLPYGCTLWKS